MLKKLNRVFTTREKVLLLALSIIILGAIYYLSIYQPTNDKVKIWKREKESLEEQLVIADKRASQIANMKSEMEGLESRGLTPSFMPSYNAERQELEFLHDILSTNSTEYQANFSTVTRDGNQIRRNFSLSFAANNYSQALNVISSLENSSIRCLIGDMSISSQSGSGLLNGPVNVNCVATFYETMYEGTEDSDLPGDSKKKTVVTESDDLG